MSAVLLAVLLAGLLAGLFTDGAGGAGGAALRGGTARGLAWTGFDFARAGFLVPGLAAAGFGAGDLDFFLVAIKTVSVVNAVNIVNVVNVVNIPNAVNAVS